MRIQELYLSITDYLFLKKAILFPQNSVNITPKSIEIIFHSRNLFCPVMMIHGLKMI